MPRPHAPRRPRVRFGRATRLALPVLLLPLLVAFPAQAQTAGPPAARVTARASVDSVAVGERFTITLTAEHEPGVLVAFPDPGSGTLTVGDIELVRRVPAARTPGAAVDSVTYEAAAFAVETAVMPPLAVRFTTASEDTFSAATDTLRLPMRAVAPPGAQEIQDLAPLVEFRRPLWFYLLIALGVLLAIAALVYWLRRRRRRSGTVAPAAPPPSPYDEAVERLHRLESIDLTAAGDVKPYYVELSDLLRTYLARRLGVAAREETTGELVRELRTRAGQPDVPDDLAPRVADILGVADLAKYADARPAPERGRAALRAAREAVDAVEAARRPAPPDPDAADAASGGAAGDGAPPAVSSTSVPR